MNTKTKNWLKLLSGSGLIGILVTLLVTGITGQPITGQVAGRIGEQISDAVIKNVTAEGDEDHGKE